MEERPTGIEDKVKSTLINYGAINENWRIKITDVEIMPNSDWAKVAVKIIKPRCRKPCIIWTLTMNMVRGLTDFEKSTFVRL